MSAFFLCFTAWCAIALSMDRHHEDAFAPAGAAPRRSRLPWQAHTLQHPACLRRAGWALLLLSLWFAAAAPATSTALGPAMSLRIVAWVVALSVSALAVTALLVWHPQRAPTMAALAMVAGLCALALGW